MAVPYLIKVYPINFDSLTVTMENGSTLSYSNFTRDVENNCLYYQGIGVLYATAASTYNNYPEPRITREENTAGEPITIIDFRPEHLYAIGDVNNDPDGYIYVNDLTNPTGIYNKNGWASNNAFDWSWKIYSNFNTVNYDSSTNIYTIGCTAYDESQIPGPH